MNTTTINGLTVLAKPDNSPLTYGNLTAAQKKADSLSSLTESWEGRKVEGYRFCVVLISRLTRIETGQVHDLEPTDIHKRAAAQIFDVPEEEVTNGMRRVGKNSNYMELYGRLNNGSDWLPMKPADVKKVEKTVLCYLESRRSSNLFFQASQIIESLRGIHSLDVIRFSPKSGSSAGKYTVKLLPEFHSNVQFPISMDAVSLLVRAGFLRPGKRNRWKFVPEKLNRSLRYLGAI